VTKKRRSQAVARSYYLTADYLVIGDCYSIAPPAVFDILGFKRI